MKSLILLAIFFLASDWPRPTASWPASQQLDEAGQNNLFQGMLGHPMAARQYRPAGRTNLLRGNFKFNPELMSAKFSPSGGYRGAFSRAAARKVGNTRFKLKSIDDEAEIVDDQDWIDEPKRKIADMPVKKESQPMNGATFNKIDPAEFMKMMEEKFMVNKAVKPASNIHTDQEVVNPVAAEASQQIAPIQTQEAINQIQESQQQHQPEELAQVKENHNQPQEINQVKEPVAEKVEQVKTLNFKRPVSSLDSWRTAEQQDHFATDNQMMLDELRNIHYNQPAQQPEVFQQSNYQAEDQVHQQIETPTVEEPRILTNKDLNFQITKPDLVNTLGVNAIKKEAERVVKERKKTEEIETLSKKTDQTHTEANENVKPLSYGPYYSPSYQGGAGYQPSKGVNGSPKTYSSYGRQAEKEAKKGKLNTETIDGNFQSLIIIANTNLNSNLGISSIDADLLKSFLSQFVGRSIESLIKDYEFSKLVDKFNKARSKSDSDKSYEYTNKLSANGPAKASNSSSSSHSESTILLKKSDDTESTKNLGYGKGYGQEQANSQIPYSYVPNKNGGVIFINNKNENTNLREVVETVLSGQGLNVGEYDSGVLLPVEHVLMTKLLDNATIITNDNTNRNVN